MVVFMAPTAWNIFSMAICSRHPKETHRTTYVYWHAISKVSPSLVKSCRKGRVTSRPKPTNKMQWSTVRAIPMVAARSAFSLRPAPKWMETAEVMPTPTPTATESTIFCRGNARETAVRAFVPRRET